MQGYAHKRIRHSQKVYVSGDIHTNTIEGFWSTVKRGIGGVYRFANSGVLGPRRPGVLMFLRAIGLDLRSAETIASNLSFFDYQLLSHGQQTISRDRKK